MQESQLDRTEKEDHEKDNPALSKVIAKHSHNHPSPY